jgi:YHS domain-containing protein
MSAQRQQRKAVCPGLALFVSLAAALTPALAAAATATTERVVVNRHTGVAIGGFDPVAYFTDKQALQGKPELEAEKNGAIWRFCNAGNRSYFLARPDIYAPQFGGYDPVGVARGVTVAGNAQIWLIVAQRLFLFVDQENRDAFAADPDSYLQRASAQWPTLLERLAE